MPTKTLPPDENPYADWSAHLYTADRTQFMPLVMDTKHSVAALQVLLAVALYFPNAAAFADSPVAPQPPPNIVLIISDDHAWTDYSLMNHPHIRTPNIDRLAAESRVFTRGYVTSSLCCPSLASIITGLYPHQHRITSNDPALPAGMNHREFRQSPAFQQGREVMNRHLEAVPTLPRMLARANYVSLQTGKWWQGDYRRGGFTHGMTRGERHGDSGLDIGRKTMQPVFDFIAQARRDNRPFFVWYAPMMPHEPHNPPARLLRKYQPLASSLPVARYWAMVEWFDETVGTMLNYLRDERLDENTLLIYIADNGWITDPATGRYAPKSKQSPYDGGLRTPIMIRWPGRVQPGRPDALASSIDLAPTLVAAAGLKSTSQLQGINLLDDEAVTRRRAIFGECFTHESRDPNNPAASLRWRWMIEGDWKLILPHQANEPGSSPELYDLAADPHEQQNLAGAQAARVAAMRGQIDGWWPAE